MPNVLSPRDLVSRPDNMDETALHTRHLMTKKAKGSQYLVFCKGLMGTELFTRSSF